MATKPHPFDQITKEEIQRSAKVIKENKQNFYPPNDSNGKKIEWNFVSMINLEPPKAILLPLLRKNADVSNIPRKSLIVLEQKGTANVVQAVVNHDNESNPIEKFVSSPGRKASLTPDDQYSAQRIVIGNPKVVDMLKNKYNITDLSRVYAAAWPFGYNGEGPEDAPYNNRKMTMVYMYFNRDDVEDNVYSHPIGFVALVDLITEEVLKTYDLPTQKGFKVDSETNFKIPDKKDNYLPKFIRDDYYRKDLKPIVITQPEGPSYTVKNKYDISWQKWNFRISFNYRTGLVFHYITYTGTHAKVPGKDGDEERGKDYTGTFNKIRHEVLYRAGLSEMLVPYGDPRFPYHRKMAFDIGEYGLGTMSNSLELGCDCLGSVTYFDFDYNDRDGNAKTIKKVICLHEEDAGISHKHTETRTNTVYLVRSRRLVVSFVATVGNYDYLYYWYFYQDGTISMEVKASGEVSTNLLADRVVPQWGTRIFPLNNALYHQHIFNVRLDFIVDGTKNTAAMLDVVPLEGEFGNETNPYGTGFTLKKTEFKTAKEAVSDADAKRSRVWIIQNDNIINEYSDTPVAWKLIPSTGFSGLLAGETSYIRKRAAFAKHAFWVTPYKDDELYAAGFYVYQSKGGEGVEAWANRNENIKDTDIVVWHTFGVTHIVRLEDFPIMPTDSCGFMIKPYNLFYQSPALDVPPPERCYKANQGPRSAEKDEICPECWWGEKRTLSTITCKHRSILAEREF